MKRGERTYVFLKGCTVDGLIPTLLGSESRFANEVEKRGLAGGCVGWTPDLCGRALLVN